MLFVVLDHIDPSEFVRHLLIESTPKGVHLKDCKDEPMFGKTILGFLRLSIDLFILVDAYTGDFFHHVNAS